jgi:NitT/TauT family transport system permease protein
MESTISRRLLNCLTSGALVLLTFLGLISAWEILARSVASTGILPAPTEVAAELAGQPALYTHHAGITLFETLAAFGLAALLGVISAIMISYSEFLQSTIYPALVVLQVIPKVAVAPFLVVWLGFGIGPKIVVGALVAFFPVVVDTLTGLRSPDQELLSLVRVLNGKRIQELIRIRLPSALPSIFSGLKVAMTLAVVGVIVGELVGGNEGLGYLIVVGNAQFRLDTSFAALTVLSTMGFGLYAILWLAEYLIMPGEGSDL